MVLKVVSQGLLLFIDNFDLFNVGHENCVSVWSFCYDSMMKNDLKDDGSFNNQSESANLDLNS